MVHSRRRCNPPSVAECRDVDNYDIPGPHITPPPPEPNILRLNCVEITGIACQRGDKLNAQTAECSLVYLSCLVSFCAKLLPRWLGRNFDNEFYWDEMGAIGFALIELFDKLIIPMHWDCGMRGSIPDANTITTLITDLKLNKYKQKVATRGSEPKRLFHWVRCKVKWVRPVPVSLHCTII